MQDEHAARLRSMEHTARRLDDLAIAAALQIRRSAAAVGMIRQGVHLREYAPDPFDGSRPTVQGDVVGDGVEVGQRRLGSDYFNHLASRSLA